MARFSIEGVRSLTLLVFPAGKATEMASAASISWMRPSTGPSTLQNDRVCRRLHRRNLAPEQRLDDEIRDHAVVMVKDARHLDVQLVLALADGSCTASKSPMIAEYCIIPAGYCQSTGCSSI
jgi:hypothetical protein